MVEVERRTDVADDPIARSHSRWHRDDLGLRAAAGPLSCNPDPGGIDAPTTVSANRNQNTPVAVSMGGCGVGQTNARSSSKVTRVLNTAIAITTTAATQPRKIDTAAVATIILNTRALRTDRTPDASTARPFVNMISAARNGQMGRSRLFDDVVLS